MENCVKMVKNFLSKYMQLEAADQDIYDTYRMGDQQEGKTKVMFIKCHPKLRQKILSKTKLLKGKHNSKGQAFFVNQQVPETIAAEKHEMSYAIKTVRDNNSGKTPDQRSKYRIKNRILYVDDNPQMKPVSPPTVSKLFVQKGEQEKTDKVKFCFSDPVEEKGSVFTAAAAVSQGFECEWS